MVRSILFRFGGKMRPEILPWVTFTEPELAHVGMSEAEAAQKHKHIQILRWPFAENDRAQTDRTTRGLVKIVTTQSGRILGADILGANAGELLAPFVLAVAEGMRVKSLATAVFPYPTLSEAARRAAIAYYAPKLQSRAVKWALRAVRRLG